MKGRLRCPSRRASALYISGTCIVFVFLFAYNENTSEHGFTQISKDRGDKVKTGYDKNRNRNEVVLNGEHADTVPIVIDVGAEPNGVHMERTLEDIRQVDVIPKGVHMERTLLENIRQIHTLNYKKQEFNIAPHNIPDTKQSNVINNVQDNIPDTKQSNVPDNIPDTKQSNVPDNIPDTKQSNVPDNIPDTKQSNVPDNIPDTKQSNVPDNIPDTKQSNVPDNIPDTKQSNVPDNIPDTKQSNVPDNIPDTKQSNVPDNIPDTKQSNVPDNIPDTKQSNVPDNIPDTKQSNVPDNIPDTKQSNVPDNIPDTKQSNVPDNIPDTKQSNVPDNILDTKQSNVPDNIPDTKQSNVPDNIPDTKQSNVPDNIPIPNVNVPFTAFEEVSAVGSDNQFSRGLFKYTGSLMGMSYTQRHHIDLASVTEVQTEQHVKTHTDNASDAVGIGDTRDVKQVSMPGSNAPFGNTNHPTPVLLLTYLRSGSTLTADIIQQVSGVFYAYEPLRPYIATNIGYISMKGICSMNNLTCRKPMLMSELLFMGDIVRYYGCDLEHVAAPFLWSEMSDSVRRYKSCTRVTAQLNTDKHFCLNQCFDSTRYLKTIRLSMDIVEVLMKIIPPLKVIHLLRDPRGMIESRKRGGFLGPRVDLTTVARSVCQRFERDIEIATKLRRKYPGRLKTYLYEQIAEHPQLASSSLFKFLGFTAPENFDMWLHNHTAAGTKGKYYSTTRANSTLTANSWRLRMPYKDVIKVDNECPNFYNYTGILKAESTKSLRDLTFQMRVPTLEFGNFL